MANLNNWIMCTDRQPEPNMGPGQGGWHTENRDSQPVLLAVCSVGGPSEPRVVEAWFRQPATVDPDGEPYDLSDEDDINDARGGWFGSLEGAWSSEVNYTHRAIAWQPYPSTAVLYNASIITSLNRIS